MPAFTTSIQHSIGSLSHSNQPRKRNKRHPNWKGGTKAITVCRWHDSVHRKSYRLHQKTTWPNKWIWQNSRIQSQYSEIDGIFIHQQKLGKNSIYWIYWIICNKKSKLLGNKFNPGDKRAVLGKLEHWTKKYHKQKSWKKSHFLYQQEK